MVKTLNFLAPSLEPSTLLDISFSEPGPSTQTQAIVTTLPIAAPSVSSSSSAHAPVGIIKRITRSENGSIVVADDGYRLSYLSERPEDGEWTPSIRIQTRVKSHKGDSWTGLIPVEKYNSGVVTSLTSGILTFHPQPSTAEEINETSPSVTCQSYVVDGPVLALASPSASSSTFALAGKEVDVSIRDVERTFGSSLSLSNGGEDDDGIGSRKKRKTELVKGEVWRAKNMPNNSLRLRPPIHHTVLAYLPDVNPSAPSSASPRSNDTSGAESSGTHLISGTKAGTIRRYDTRQKKPVGEYKLAREGGIAALAPINQHEVFFSDKGNFLGCADLRTGRPLYSYSSMTSSAQHMTYIPPLSSLSNTTNGTSETGEEIPSYLASISPDATLRLHSTIPPRKEGQKGNPEGGKARIVGMAGGVGIGSFIFNGYGERSAEEGEGATRVDGEGGDGDEDEEDVWDGMDAIEGGEGSSDEDE